MLDSRLAPEFLHHRRRGGVDFLAAHESGFPTPCTPSAGRSAARQGLKVRAEGGAESYRDQARVF